MSEPDCGEIYEKYRNKVFGYALSKVRNSTEAEDIVQTVFLKVFRNLGTYDKSKASLSTWIYTITRNTVYDYISKARVHEELAVAENMSEQTETADECIEKKESLKALVTALEKLPTDERDVIILIYYHGKSKKETAEILGLTYGQLRYIHDRALSSLSELI
ncbi:MAG: RNA polymerase sigma factor [Candidatus Coproplasma sp.]